MSVFRKILRTYKMDDPILEQLIKLKWDPKNDGKARTFNYLQSEYKLAHSVTIFLYSFLSFNYVCKPSSCFNPFVNPRYKYHPHFVVWRILDNPEFMISSSRFYKVICFRCVLNKCIGYFLENYITKCGEFQVPPPLFLWCLRVLDVREQGREYEKSRLTHSFPMHLFSKPWKYQITLRFFDVFRG